MIDTKITFSNESLNYVRSLVPYRENEKILVIAPGANSTAKMWSVKNFIELINNIKNRFDKIVLVGSALEAAVCDEVGLGCEVINLAGKTTLGQSAALFSYCTMFVGNDSGLGHIAAAQGVPTLAIFAHADISYADPIRYTPYGQHSIYRSSNDEPMVSVEDVMRRLGETILR